MAWYNCVCSLPVYQALDGPEKPVKVGSTPHKVTDARLKAWM